MTLQYRIRRSFLKVLASERPDYTGGRWLFLRLLGLVYLIAILSLWSQIEGLVGSDGILPVADHLDSVRERLGSEGYSRLPTLLWLGAGDLALNLWCGLGVMLALLLVGGVAQRPLLFSLWAVYLSLVQGGQTFFNFQWDILLLETGLVALFLAPPGWRPRLPRSEPAPPSSGLWLIWLLLFKLMFLSGAVKPLSMDETWWKLTALDYHYWTQPLPVWTSWYAHQLPAWFQKLSVLFTCVVEMLLPFAIFSGRIGRRLVAGGTVLLMLLISWTGNYGFFNLLTIALCAPLVDDGLLRRFMPRVVGQPARSSVPTSIARRVRLVLRTALVTLLIGLSTLTLAREIVRTAPGDIDGLGGATLAAMDRLFLSWSRPLFERIGPFRSVNGYGLFRAMTTARPEIAIEGSADGVTWVAYEFRWKPGDLARRLRFVAPHMPRLDWQMWFASLNPRRAQPWLQGLTLRLLEGSPTVLRLLDNNPFPGAPPRYVRLVSYRYEFATPEERARGLWWRREQIGYLTRPIALADLQR